MTTIDQANRTAVERMMASRPMLTGVGRALDVIPGMRQNLLLHAGPPMHAPLKMTFAAVPAFPLLLMPINVAVEPDVLGIL